MNTNDIDRLKAEIRYLRNCLLEAYNALPTLPCTSLDSYSVVSPIMRGIREYCTSYDEEFEPKKVERKRRKVSSCLSVSAEDRPARMASVKVDNVPVAPKPFSVPKSAQSTARSLGFDIDFS